MYRGAAFEGKYYHRRRNELKNWKLIVLAAAFTAVIGIFLFVTLKVIAAPENPGIEAAAAAGQQEAGAQPEENEADSTEEAAVTEVTEGMERLPGVPLIVVDPGHGGIDEGCSADGVLEKEINLEIARLVQAKLQEMGYQVLLAREDDTYIAKEERVETANRYGADLYVSIHQNTYEEPQVCGLETWYDGSDTSRDSRRLARLIHQETLKSTGAQERELKDDADFCVTGSTAMPACLIETGFLSNPEECVKLATAQYQEQIAAGIAAGIELYFHPKTMYLTFDDGPSAENTCTVLDILKAHNVKATFFVVGENVRRNPEVAKRIAAEGHTIGIHCNRHEYEELYGSVESYLMDFEEAYNAVREVTGVEPQLFRFPGGSINSYNGAVSRRIIDEMTARGFIYFDWNASLEDAVKDSEPQELIKNAKETTLGRQRVVMLAHDIAYHTTLCLEELLDSFPEYQMEPLTPEVEPVQFH